MKELSLEKKELLISKKKKEIEKLAKKQLKPVVGRYLAILFVMVTLNFCVDIFGSNIHDIMKADALNHLVPELSKESGFQLYENLALIFGAVVTALLPLYKSLTDKFGRKLFLIINTVITTIGMLIMMVSTNLIVYIIGFVISTVGFQGDVHQIYILESAPKKLRARFASLTKAISVLCIALVGLFRYIFYSDAIENSWRYVFIIPVMVGLLVATLSCFLTQETETFVNNRKNTLKTEIDILNGKEIKKNDNAKPLSIKEVLSFIFTHRQTLMLFIAACLFCGAMAFTKPYSVILDTAENENAISVVTIIYPFIEGAFSLIGGFISDKFGRKTTVIVNGVIFILAYTLFIIGIKLGFPVILLGVVYGMTAGGYWAGRDTLGTTMPSESVPTKSRATIVGIFTLVTGLTSTITGALFSNLPALAGFDLAYTYLVGCVILMALSVFFVIVGVSETKGVDMETVTGNEWNK